MKTGYPGDSGNAKGIEGWLVHSWNGKSMSFP